MYDVNNDGFITQDELLSLLSMMVGSNITPEQVCLFTEQLFCVKLWIDFILWQWCLSACHYS